MFLRLIFEREPLLSQPFASCQILLGQPAFALVPQRYLAPDHKLTLARVLLDDWAFAEEIISRPLPGSLQASLLFLQTQNLQGTLQTYLPFYTLTHISQSLIGLSGLLAEEHPSHITLCLQDQQLLLLAFKEGNLQLCNHYPWQAPADIVYFVEAVRAVCGLHDDDVPVFVCGELEAESEVARAIWRYIPGLRFPSILRPQQYGKLAYWKYAFLPQHSPIAQYA